MKSAALLGLPRATGRTLKQFEMRLLARKHGGQRPFSDLPRPETLAPRTAERCAQLVHGGVDIGHADPDVEELHHFGFLSSEYRATGVSHSGGSARCERSTSAIDLTPSDPSVRSIPLRKISRTRLTPASPAAA